MSTSIVRLTCLAPICHNPHFMCDTGTTLDWRGRSEFDPCVMSDSFYSLICDSIKPTQSVSRRLCADRQVSRWNHHSAPWGHYSHFRQDFLPPTNSITAAIGMQIHSWRQSETIWQIAANSFKRFKSSLFIIIHVNFSCLTRAISSRLPEGGEMFNRSLVFVKLPAGRL